MKKRIQRLGIVVGAFVIVGALGAPTLAFARNVHAEDTPSDSTTMSSDSVSTRRAEVQQRVAQKREAVQTRLQDAKLRVCQNREKAITSIMARISDRGQKHAELFGTIATRAEAFYAKKGKTLATYDQLVSDVTAKRTAAQTEVQNVKMLSTTFTCTGDNPKGVIQSFKDALKSELTALKDYRTSVKNLIVGIKSVQSTTATTQEAR